MGPERPLELRHEIIDGLRVAYRRAGAGPALVLLHGFASDSRLWQPQLDDLSTDFDVIAWDAPGAGATPDPPADFTFEDWAASLARLLDALELARIHVLGLSWGGVLAQVVHRLDPGRTRSLILADTYAGWTGSLGAEVAARRLASAIEDSELRPEAFAARYLPSMFGPSPPASAVAALDAVLRDRHPAAFRAMATALAHADTRDHLEQIDVPTLLLWGDHDVRSPLSVGQDFASRIRGSRLVEIPGAGHVSNLDRPAEFNAAVSAFLRSLDPGLT